MSLSSDELEKLADHLLSTDLKNKKRNKTRTDQFPVLSDSQMKRRSLMEIPYSNLTEKQRIECRVKNMDYYTREGD